MILLQTRSLEGLALLEIRTMEKADKDLVSDLLFGVRKSIRYHDRRRAWFERWHNMLMVAAVFATIGAAALSFTVLNLVTGILLALDIVIGPPRRAALHQQLRSQFIELEQKFALVGKQLSEQEYQRFYAERLRIEVHEPPIKALLNLLCHFEQWRSQSNKADLSPLKEISWFKKWSAQCFSYTDDAVQIRLKTS